MSSKLREKPVGEIRIRLKKWVDGEQVEEVLEAPDRWSVHEADTVDVDIYGINVRILQRPKALRGNKIGVGACLWDGAIMLSGVLGTLPRHLFPGARIVELGAGVGLAGLLAAAYGAQVTVTDIEKVLGLLAENCEANGYVQGKLAPAGKGWCSVRELEWGKEGYMDVVESLGPCDMVLAADCCYIDGDGVTPSTEHFVRAAKGLLAPQGVFYCASEIRSSDVRNELVALLKQHFTKVEKLPLLGLPQAFRVEHMEIFACKLTS